MSRPFTRRQVLAQIGIAAAAVHTLDPHELCCGPMSAYAQTNEKNLFELTKVADGVYGAIAGPAYKTNSNGAVIVTNDGIVVIDTHSKPSAAMALFKDVQAVSKNPVKKVVNTHFHWDHWQGNEYYKAANPNVEIITSEQTKQNLTNVSITGVGGIAHIKRQLDGLPGEIQKLKDDIAKATDPTRRANAESNLRQAEAFFEEMKKFTPVLPTRTVSSRVTTLNEGGREIQLLVLGRAHTDGDVFIYLPKEKVVVTGDALVDWMPYMPDSYPEEWVQTLAELEKLDITHVIPGHGNVVPKSGITFLKNYIADLVDAVKKASAAGATLDEMKTKIGDQLAGKYEAGFSKYWTGRYRDRVGTNVEHVVARSIKKS